MSIIEVFNVSSLLVSTSQPKVFVSQTVNNTVLSPTSKSAKVLVAANASRKILTASQGPQGVPGLPGLAGEDTVVNKIATTALSGNRAVVADGATSAVYASNSILAHKHFLLGITTGAASAGATAQVQTAGEMVEPSWSWAVGRVFLGVNGLLTQSPSATGFVQQVGLALSATKIRIAFGEPITLI